MSAFDIGLQSATQRSLEDARIAQEQRQSRQNAIGAQLLDAINQSSNIKPTMKDENGNVVPNPAYEQAQKDRRDLLTQYTSLYSPEQHASFGQHLHGLIFGHADHRPQQPALSPNSSPNEPVESAGSPTAPGAGAATPAPTLHPGAALTQPAPEGHPIHAITKGIKALGDHLSAFAHPLPAQPQPDTALMAKYYRDPAEVAHERLMEGLQQKGATAVDVAKIRSQYALLNTPEKMFLDTAAKSLKGPQANFLSLDPDQQADLFTQYKNASAPKIQTDFVQDANSPTGWSRATWNPVTQETYDVYPGVRPPAGLVAKHRVNVSTDPFGLKTTSVSDITPAMPGGSAQPFSAPPVKSDQTTAPQPAPAKASQVPASANPGARPPGTVPGGGAVKTKPVSGNAPLPPLDENGHIPAGVGNDLIRQAANGILDGRDPKEFGNPKVQTAALALVEKFVPGYSRGAFTPKEKLQVNNATTFLNQLHDSKALSVLDNFYSREKIFRAMKAPEHMGLLDRIAAFSLNKDEAEFLRDFNIAKSTVAGLSQLTRPGRATNSQVSSIATELPNVFQSPSSEDAKKRLENLLKEADTALHTNPRDVGKAPVSKSAPATPGTTQKFTDGGVTYNIPAEQVAAFKKDHPNAR